MNATNEHEEERCLSDDLAWLEEHGGFGSRRDTEMCRIAIDAVKRAMKLEAEKVRAARAADCVNLTLIVQRADLLEACRALVECGEVGYIPHPDTLDRARAAISKAVAGQ